MQQLKTCVKGGHACLTPRQAEQATSCRGFEPAATTSAACSTDCVGGAHGHCSAPATTAAANAANAHTIDSAAAAIAYAHIADFSAAARAFRVASTVATASHCWRCACGQ